MSKSPAEQDSLPNLEIEIAADAIRALWQSERNQQAIRETGHGASFLAMARTALAAAAKVRGKTAITMEGRLQ